MTIAQTTDRPMIGELSECEISLRYMIAIVLDRSGMPQVAVVGQPYAIAHQDCVVCDLSARAQARLENLLRHAERPVQRSPRAPKSRVYTTYARVEGRRAHGREVNNGDD
jgi:hypothetical protein